MSEEGKCGDRDGELNKGATLPSSVPSRVKCRRKLCSILKVNSEVLSKCHM